MTVQLDMTTRVTLVLCGAVDYIQTFGWGQHRFVNTETGAACVQGACNQGRPLEATVLFDTSSPNTQARLWMARAITGERVTEPAYATTVVSRWNDTPGRTQDDALRLLYTTLDLVLMMEEL